MSEEKYTLYYIPGSYYSQKVVLCCYEKDVNFQKCYVDIESGHNFEPWYMRLNPNGNVPTLQHGDKVLIESDDILHYIDKKVKVGPTLFPDSGSTIGKEVDYWYKKLSVIQIENISFGVLRHAELSATGPKVPRLIRRFVATPEGINKRFKKATDTLLRYAEKYPDLREVYLNKLSNREDFYTGNSCTFEKTSKILDELETLFDEIEAQLKKTKQAQNSDNFWLLGSEFTAPDIIMVIFLDRLNMVGLTERYFGATKRVLVNDYYLRLGSRKSVQKLRAHVFDTVKVILGSKLKQTLPTILGIGSVILAAGAAYYFWHRK